MKSLLTPIERFWSKVCKTDNCWNWTAGKDWDLYGAFKVNGVQVKAHRYSYELANGPIPDNMQVCHTCDNPSCVNPEHLFLGTTQENTADREAKGRGAKGKKHWKTRLTEADVQFIRHSSLSAKVLAQQFGILAATIYKIKKGILWKSLPNLG